MRLVGEKIRGAEATRQISLDPEILARQTDEAPLRRQLLKSERTFAGARTTDTLKSVEKDRSLLADCLYSKGKTQEADNLLYYCIRDEERLGKLQEQSIDGLYYQWRQMGLTHSRSEVTVHKLLKNTASINVEITKYGVNPKQWLIESMRNARVLAIGEEHSTRNPNREFLTNMMVDLKEAGATHLAIEFPAERAYMLDHYLEKGTWDSYVVNGEISNPFDLECVQALQLKDDTQRMLSAAKDAGLKVVPVDSGTILNDGITTAKFGASRNQYMADEIANILSFDKKAKVLFYAGAHHVATHPKEVWHDSAAEILKRLDYKVVSVYSQIPNSAEPDAPLYPATRFVDQAIAVPTKNARNIGHLPEGIRYDPMQQNLNAWDAVIIYPQEK